MALIHDLLGILAWLHELAPPVIHRDVKPQNILVRPDGKLVLIDFGLATDAGDRTFLHTMVVGTLGYQAPEQIAGEPVPVSDVYSAAVVALELLTRRSPRALLSAQTLRWERAASSLPDPVQAWLRRALAPDLKDRFRDAREALDAFPIEGAAKSLAPRSRDEPAAPRPDGMAVRRTVEPVVKHFLETLYFGAFVSVGLGAAATRFGWIPALFVGSGVAAGFGAYALSLTVVRRPDELLVVTGRTNTLPTGEQRPYRIITSARGLLWHVERAERMSLAPIPIRLRFTLPHGASMVEVELMAEVSVNEREPMVHRAIQRFLGAGRAEIEQVGAQMVEGAVRNALAQMTQPPSTWLHPDFRFPFAEKLMESEEDFHRVGLVLWELRLTDVREPAPADAQPTA